MTESDSKKRAKPVTMTSRSKRWLEGQGYIVGLVERSIWIPKKAMGVPTGEKFLQKFDLWSFADLAAVHPDLPGTLYIQTTTQDHAAERREKIRQAVAAPVVLRGNRIQVHGWAKRGARGARKLWTVNVYEARFGPGLIEFVEQLPIEVEDDGTQVASLFSASEPQSAIGLDSDF